MCQKFCCSKIIIPLKYIHALLHPPHHDGVDWVFPCRCWDKRPSLCQHRGILYLLYEDGLCVLVRILCLCYALQQALSAPVVGRFYLKFKFSITCIVLLHLSNSCLCCWFFEQWGQSSNLSWTRPFFTSAKGDAVWTCGLRVKVIFWWLYFNLINRRHS